MTIGEISDYMRLLLEPKFGTSEARAIMRIIFEDTLNLRPVDIVVNPNRQMPPFIDEKIRSIINRLLNNEPIQYIIGRARFCGMDFAVTPDTLIPRPETAELIDIITDRYRHKTDLRILDLGTGSGCIAIALSRALKFPQITAIDISQPALDIARKNAADHSVKINFMQADILNLNIDAQFDIIVSNPPYVLNSEQEQMEPHVLYHEPHSALFVPDSNPMLFYDAILKFAKNRAKAVFFEINPLCANLFSGAQIINDAFGKKRFAIYDPFA